MRTRLSILGVLILLALGGLVGAHARCLTRLPGDPRFVRFLRRYDRRPNVNGRIPPHGKMFDRTGALLPAPPSGSALENVIDDLSLASGGGVRLTLDRSLQETATRLMSGHRGALVALEPATGRIRALVSSPSAADLNRALNGLYPPGSTFKIFMAAAALSVGVDPLFDCPAEGYRSGRGTPAIRDVEARAAVRNGQIWRGFGKIGMGEALTHSSNVYFAQLGVALGSDRFDAAVRSARLRDGLIVLTGRSTVLASAAGGVPEGLRAPALAPVSIGQGALQLTPLAVAEITAAVANDGVLVTPTLSVSAAPSLRGRPFTFESAYRVKQMMRAVVRSGTGRGCDLPGLDVCGKTGTAETGHGADHAWFTCFAPQRTPRLVVTVVVERGGFGATTALPIARAFLLEAQSRGWFK